MEVDDALALAWELAPEELCSALQPSCADPLWHCWKPSGTPSTPKIGDFLTEMRWILLNSIELLFVAPYSSIESISFLGKEMDSIELY